MNSNFHVNGNDIYQYLDAKNRRLLDEYCGSVLTQEQVLYLMNRAAMEGLKYGSDLTMSAAHASLVVQQCKARAAEQD